ncbi:MAG: glycoside hydrolase family 5 protein, partial [Flavobacteriaceae bacterium]|nr:glycoside hydrolase family 5 protein [Flavobacteriaceae bacterium]
MKFNFLIIILIYFPLFAQITPEQMVEKMDRGINLGNVLSAPIEGNWAPAVEKQYFLDVATAGFTTVRIPMDFFGDRTSGSTEGYSSTVGTSGSYTGSIADYTVSSNYLNRIEQIVDWALNAGLVTIIDIHGSTLKTEFLYTFDRKNRHPNEKTSLTSAKRLADLDKFTAIWTGISNRFKNKSENLLFEVVNEPYFELTEDDMNALNISTINTIRNTGGNNNTRIIIITGGDKNSYEAPTTIDPAIIAGDDYLIATFHYYNPNDFTKSTRDDKNQNTFGSASDKTTVGNHFESVLTWSNTNDIPILLGEFGADNTLGYNYSEGDLNKISTNATGYANG